MKRIFFSQIHNRGFSVIEAVVGIMIALTIIVTFSTLTLKAIKINEVNAKELKAILYLQEIIEISKDLEQSDWNSLTNPLCTFPQPCHPGVLVFGNSWILIPGEEQLEGDVYTRSLTVEDVFRQQLTNEIISFPCAQPCVLSQNTKKIITTITWNSESQSRNLILETYVYNYNL